MNIDLIAAHAITPKEAVWATYYLALSLMHERIPGDFVECGVYAGAHPAAMALAIHQTGEWERRIHLFDSFEGIPLSGPRDHDWHKGFPESRFDGDPAVAVRKSSGISSYSLEAVKSNMAQWGIDPGLLVYHAGWFHDTVPTAEIGQIALLRLDGDLYESTKVCMEHLYPKVVPGGWVICDDFTLDGCREAVMPYLTDPESCPVYWRKP